MPNITIIGGGLAGCEAAYQLASRGIKVKLYEMKPLRRSPAHNTDLLAELVCSNSLRSDRLQNAVGLLKEELRRLGSFVMGIADETRVPAGGALAVDREGFSRRITEEINTHPHIEVIHEEVENIPQGNVIIATGPLTDGKLMDEINDLTGGSLHFYDAAAPIVTFESIDMDKAFFASRYDRGNDYLNCAMDREQYFAFVHELISAQTAPLHSFETPRVFEGCMPVEVMAKRGEMTLAFGPLKPVGIDDPHSDKKPFAIVQLRRDDTEGRLYNIVGFQTNLKFSEQKRVFSMIPGLENACFVRYGVMHRNSFINSPGLLDIGYRLKSKPEIHFAGQLTGVEGYVESVASGYTAAISAYAAINGKTMIDFTKKTAIGALSHYVSEYAGSDFQPMNVTFGIMDPFDERIRKKQERYTAISKRSLDILGDSISKIDSFSEKNSHSEAY